GAAAGAAFGSAEGAAASGAGAAVGAAAGPEAGSESAVAPPALVAAGASDDCDCVVSSAAAIWLPAPAVKAAPAKKIRVRTVPSAKRRGRECRLAGFGRGSAGSSGGENERSSLFRRVGLPSLRRDANAYPRSA